ncbi:MAG: AsmA-like C-terminal domain-containing protein, partial [Sulfurimonas sp.]|nr:AsmA-like C-terminal domain-containing protein [Sulfurimonas sp.]
QDYDVEYMLNDKEWKLKFNSLDKIAEYSNILNKYSLTNGSFMLHKVKDKENIDFTLNSDYKYKLLVNGNKPVDNYTAKGKINVNTEFMRFNINDAVDVIVDDDIRINAKNIGINRDEIVNLLDDEMMTKGSKSNSKFSFESTNCYIYFSEDRRAVSDKLDLQYFNNLLTAQLKHKEGSAYFKFLDDDFHLYGENFNDEFMENLFAVSKFKGGKLEFSIDGTTKEYVGSIYAKDTTIRNYRVLNNILAFVNTVPSLVTFSLPGYNTKGLKADSTYINFGFKDDVYTMTDIALKSKEIDILGHGVASIKNNSINLELNLRTDLGSSLSKVPLVGYILLGDESISTSLTVTGKLDDPDVNTQVAKDIMVAPLNIIKRTFMFPFEIFKDKKDR